MEAITPNQRALDYYPQALRQSGTPAMQHTQFGLLLDRAWALHLARGAVAGGQAFCVIST
jgi:hypothetical protein